MTSRRRLFIWFLLGTLGTGLFVAVLYALLAGAQYSKSSSETSDAIRDTQVSNHELLTKVIGLSHRIDDCTKPAGRCHQRGQRQTAAAVGQINREAIARAACGFVLARQFPHATPVVLTHKIDACIGTTLRQLNQTQ